MGSGPRLPRLDIPPLEIKEGEALYKGFATLLVEVRGGADHAKIVPGVAQSSGPALVFTQFVAGERAHEIVQAVAFGGVVPFEQGELFEISERLFGCVLFRLPDGRRGGGIECVGKDGQQDRKSVV